ncbi:hypothetical protein Ancab_011980 [Ancistrocladus abbreviatus]
MFLQKLAVGFSGCWLWKVNGSVYSCSLKSWSASLPERAVYAIELEEMITALKSAVDEHKSISKYVRPEFTITKQMHMLLIEKEEDEILQLGAQEIQKKCLENRCPKNFRFVSPTSVNISEQRAEDLYELPMEKEIGWTPHLRMRKWFQEYKEGSIGLYRMEGAGNSTLLKRPDNDLFKRQHAFDLVIWVVAPEQAREDSR